MELLVIITVCTLAFFGGICVGAVLTSLPERGCFNSVEESYQPIETVCVEDFEKAAEPLIKFLAENNDLYTTAIVTSTSAELLDGVIII